MSKLKEFCEFMTIAITGTFFVWILCQILRQSLYQTTGGEWQGLKNTLDFVKLNAGISMIFFVGILTGMFFSEIFRRP